MTAPPYYWDYLQLDQLLDCQRPVSARHGEPAHDELLFIIVHQVFELWFKQVLFELDAVLEVLAADVIPEKEMGEVVARLGRITTIQRLLLDQIDVLETMTPLDFLDFRDELIPASGFQSVQFRLIENRLGLRPPHRLKIRGSPYLSAHSDQHARQLEASHQQPSLLDHTKRWLERTPFLHFGDYDFWRSYQDAVHKMLAKEHRVIELHPNLNDEGRAEQLATLEQTAESFAAVFDPDRRHALLAHRMIGKRIGTGGTAGYAYLEAAARQHRVFGDLFGLPTFFIPRSALPTLPPAVTEQMGFRYRSSRR